MQNQKPITKFLDPDYYEPASIDAYTAAMKKFFFYTYTKPKDWKKLDNQAKMDWLDQSATQYLTDTDRDIITDVKEYSKFIATKMSSKTWGTYINALRAFLKRNHIQKIDFKAQDEIFFKKLKKQHVRKVRPQTQDRSPTRDELRDIITSTSLHGKALFDTLATSGMRIGECLKLTIDDFDFETYKNQKIVKIFIPKEYTKTKIERTILAAPSSYRYLQQWLKERESFIKQASIRVNGIAKKSIEDDRMFPFTYELATMLFNKTKMQNGMNKRDAGTNRYHLHIHSLRKYFKTNTTIAGLKELDIEFLMGHVVKDLNGNYYRPDINYLIHEYLKAVPLLDVKSQQNPELENRIKQQQKELTQQKQLTVDTVKTLNRTSDTVTALEEKIKKQDDQITQLQTKIGRIISDNMAEEILNLRKKIEALEKALAVAENPTLQAIRDQAEFDKTQKKQSRK